MSPRLRRTVQRPSCDDLDSAVVGQLEDDVVVDEVKRPVERVDGQLGGPVQLNLVQGQGPLAGHRLPGGPVVLVADERRDDAVLVDLADVGAVGDEDLTVDADGDAWKSEKGLKFMGSILSGIRP